MVQIGTTLADDEEESEVGRTINRGFEALATPLQEPASALSGWTAAPVTEGLADLTRTKIQRQESVFGQTEQRLEEDRARMVEAHKATGVQVGELQPWDAQANREKFHTDPLQAFGSIGSVFAMIASAFTRDPMTNALNGAAAAMNAVKAGDDEGYKRAYDAWKANNDLTVQRHNIQQRAYDNAGKLMETDLNLGRAKMQMEATRFGDQKMLWLLEQGLDKEVFELQRQRAQAVEENVKASEALTAHGFKTETFKAMMKDYDTQAAELSGQSPAEIAGRKLALYNHVFGKSIPVPQEAFGLLLMGMPDAPIEKVIQRAQDMGIMPHRIGSSAQNMPAEIARRAKAYEEDPNSPTFGDHTASYNRAAQEVRAANAAPAKQGTKPEFVASRVAELLEQTPGLSKTDAEKKALEEWGKANQSRGNTDLTIDRQNAAAVATAKEGWRKDGSMSEEEIATRGAQMAAKLKAAATPPSANRLDDLRSQITRLKLVDDAISNAEALMKKHRMITGLGGTISRPFEVAGNIIGASNETDRKQFQRYIEEMRELGPRLLQESRSRPLSAEESRIATIVPGLSAGDTTQNTARGLYELRKLFRTLRGDLTKRLEGNFVPDEAGAPAGRTGRPAGSTPTEPSKGKMPWDKDPIDQPASGKRSALDDDEMEAVA